MYSRGASVVCAQNTHENRPWSSHRLYGFMYALHRPHRTGPSPSACSTTWMGSSSGCGSARGCTSSVKGMPLWLSKSPECGIVLRVLRMYRGLQLPRSRAQNVVLAGGGCVAPPRSPRVSCCTTDACASCGGRGICAGSMRGAEAPPGAAGGGAPAGAPGGEGAYPGAARRTASGRTASGREARPSAAAVRRRGARRSGSPASAPAGGTGSSPAPGRAEDGRLEGPSEGRRGGVRRRSSEARRSEAPPIRGGPPFIAGKPPDRRRADRRRADRRRADRRARARRAARRRHLHRRSSAARHRRSARHRLGRASAGWSHQRRPSGGWSRGSADRPPDRGRGCADAHARHLRGRGREPVRSGSRRLRLRLRLPLELRLDLSGGRRRGSRSAHRGSAGSRSARGADAGRPRGRHHRSRRSARRSTARAGKACFADGIIVRGAREGDRVASGVGGDGVRSRGRLVRGGVETATAFVSAKRW